MAGMMSSALASPRSAISPRIDTIAVCGPLTLALPGHWLPQSITQIKPPISAIHNRVRSMRQRRAARRSRTSAISSLSMASRSQ